MLGCCFLMLWTDVQRCCINLRVERAGRCTEPSLLWLVAQHFQDICPQLAQRRAMLRVWVPAHFHESTPLWLAPVRNLQVTGDSTHQLMTESKPTQR